MKSSRGIAKKEAAVKDAAKKASKYKYLLIAEASGLPSNTFERMRKILGKDVFFVYAQKVVIKKALEGLNEKLSQKADEVKMPVLLATNKDPFELIETIKKNKEYTKIKPGQTANTDVVLPAGPTPFPPGPMLSQFSSIGVKTKTEGGKISIVSDTTVVKKGGIVDEKISSILSSMGIKPNELMLNVVFAADDGIIFSHDLLYKSKDEYLNEMKKAFSQALSLSLAQEIVNRYSIKEIIKKLYIGVNFLSVNRNIVNKSTVNGILTKAASQAAALNRIIGG